MHQLLGGVPGGACVTCAYSWRLEYRRAAAVAAPDGGLRPCPTKVQRVGVVRPG